MAYQDFKEQYLGSYLGAFWALLRPLLFVAVIWFVFSVGFKSQPTSDGTPFILWLLCGLVPWFFFAESVNKSCHAIVNNAFLVKKAGFNVAVLPIVKIASALLMHIVFLTLLLSLFLFYGYYPSLYWLQIPYYLASMLLLLIGIGWLTSSLRVFIKDIGEIVAVVIQFGFWLTPIFWSLNIIPEQYQQYVKLNPMFYIVEGYRNSLIEQKWFWGQTWETIVFLVTVIILLILGALSFKRLKAHFGDVL